MNRKGLIDMYPDMREHADKIIEKRTKESEVLYHFQKFNAPDVKSILPLSFSQLTDFAFRREVWALRRIFGYNFKSNAASERGKAVESGLNMWLNGIDKQDAIDKMIDEYHANCKLFSGQNYDQDTQIKEEEANLIPLFEKGVSSFREFGFKWNLLDYQKKVELDILGIPIIGYTDFHFEDKQTKEDFYIDLKTTKRKPSSLSMAHAMQQSIYHKGTNSNQRLWYLVAKKTGSEFFDYRVQDYETPFKICEQIVCAMINYLKSVDTLEDVKNTLIPNPDDWHWRDKDVLDARKEVWGY